MATGIIEVDPEYCVSPTIEANPGYDTSPATDVDRTYCKSPVMEVDPAYSVSPVIEVDPAYYFSNESDYEMFNFEKGENSLYSGATSSIIELDSNLDSDDSWDYGSAAESEPAPHLSTVSLPIGGDSTPDLSNSWDSRSWSESGMTSLTSEDQEHAYENGRRYHGFKANKYLWPNDEEEQDRMDLSHHIYLLCLKGKLGIAPVIEPKRVLDLGCGTGIWALDAANKWPKAEVIGSDLSAIQPTWVPANVRFVVDDIEEPWSWPPNHFDYIHAGDLAGHLDSWPRLIARAYAALKPGGYIELRDCSAIHSCRDGSNSASSYRARWTRLLQEAIAKSGRSWLEAVEKQETYLRDAGFEEVTRIRRDLPVGPWEADPKKRELGLYVRQNSHSGVEGITLAPFTRMLGWNAGEVRGLLESVKKELMDKRIHTYHTVAFTYGRKPLRRRRVR